MCTQLRHRAYADALPPLLRICPAKKDAMSVCGLFCIAPLCLLTLIRRTGCADSQCPARGLWFPTRPDGSDSLASRSRLCIGRSQATFALFVSLQASMEAHTIFSACQWADWYYSPTYKVRCLQRPASAVQIYIESRTCEAGVSCQSLAKRDWSNRIRREMESACRADLQDEHPSQTCRFARKWS